MALFVMADLHLSLSVDKPMDIFGGWQDYVQKIEYNWQNKVKSEDTVVIPGDISWAMSLEESVKDFEFLDRNILDGLDFFRALEDDFAL